MSQEIRVAYADHLRKELAYLQDKKNLLDERLECNPLDASANARYNATVKQIAALEELIALPPF